MGKTTYRLFIVEDHPTMREVYTSYFEYAGGFSVCGTADSAEEALLKLADISPDISPHIVLVDISLPGMNGLQLVERLTTEYPTLPAVVVSGHEDSHYRSAALRAGAADFVSKGSAAVILETVRKVLAG